MHLWITSVLLAAPNLVLGFTRNVSGVEYEIKLHLEEGSCLISVEQNANNEVTNPWAANVSYRSEYLQIGWDYVEVVTNPNALDVIQAFSAGYCEGVLTCESIFNLWSNVMKDFCNNRDDFCKEVNTFLDGNTEWVDGMIAAYANESFWHQVNLYNIQLHGIFEGQKRCKNHVISERDLLMMNLMAEIEEMEYAFNVSGGNNSRSKEQGSSRCSALIKLLPEYSDLLVAHNTWSGYDWMLRQIKKYSLGYHIHPYSREIITGRTMAFSGYPGIISSVDDFYVIDSGLVVLETTLENPFTELWLGMEPANPINKVSTLARAVVANRLSKNGSDWTSNFEKYNNGFYNNQWMVVDMNRFTPGTEPRDGTLWVFEQIPGFGMAEDMTHVLINKTYWPSYNRPSFPLIINMSSCVELEKTYGDWISYENTARAKIFARDHSKVVDTDTMMKLMRYNDYMNDPFSRCNCTPPYTAESTIASRCDLNPVDGNYPFEALGHDNYGAIDAKLTSFSLSQNLKFIAINGPTNGTNLPEFDWRTSVLNKTVHHYGQPDVFRFPHVTTDWKM